MQTLMCLTWSVLALPGHRLTVTLVHSVLLNLTWDNNLLHPGAMTRDTAPFSPSSTLSGTLIQHSSSVHAENKDVALSSTSGPVTDE